MPDLLQHLGCRWACALLLALTLPACGPRPDPESGEDAVQDEDTARRDKLRQTLGTATEEEAAVKTAQESQAPEGEGTAKDWIQRTLEAVEGDALFPRWEAHRRGMEKYDVWFTYTLVPRDGPAEKQGYSWNVDLVLKLVAKPRLLKPEELGVRPSRYFQRRDNAPSPAEPETD
jgi:hypothetical protein